MSDLLNRLQHKFLGVAPAIKQIYFVNSILLLDELLQEINSHFNTHSGRDTDHSPPSSAKVKNG
jgi:hypothetical protein